MVKINKEKLSIEANKVLIHFNATKEAIGLILSGAGVNEYGVKIIDQKFSSAQEGFNVFHNLVIEEINKFEAELKRQSELS